MDANETQIAHDHFEILCQGVEAWNKWRLENPAIKPCLAGTDLSEKDLRNTNLDEADLSEADLFRTDLRGANLKMANLRKADLSGADLSGAALYKADLTDSCLLEGKLIRTDLRSSSLIGTDLRAADLTGCDLSEADLSGANLKQAKLTQSNLSSSNIGETNLCQADISGTNFTSLRYGNWRSMRGHYYGLRGLESCYGSAVFVRDAKDQDYLDTLEREIESTSSSAVRTWKRFWFTVWSVFDYGRSLGKAGLFGLAVALGFAGIYWLDMVLGWNLISYPPGADGWLSPFYFSVVTYTTLGYGDITPGGWLGQAIVITEVVLGYTTLGLLLSILANKVARRS